jgi:hypothetical protein
MATILRKQLRIARTDSGTPPVVYDLPEAVNSTWSEGSLLIVNANGELTLASGDDDLAYWGIAENAGQNGTNKRARCYRITTDLVCVANEVGAAAANVVSLIADHGPMGLIYDDTPKLFHLDQSEQGGVDDRVFVIQVAPGSSYRQRFKANY